MGYILLRLLSQCRPLSCFSVHHYVNVMVQNTGIIHIMMYCAAVGCILFFMCSCCLFILGDTDTSCTLRSCRPYSVTTITTISVCVITPTSAVMSTFSVVASDFKNHRNTFHISVIFHAGTNYSCNY